MELSGKILIYDDHCTFCSWYSGVLVKLGLLKEENRIAFSQAPSDILSIIDPQKGQNEIPLVDVASLNTLYGLDTLLEVIGQKFPVIKSIGNFKPLKWATERIYRLISFNRKVIVARKCGPGKFDCSPGFNVFYRSLFMIIFLFFNSIMLLPLHQHLFSLIYFYHLSFWHLQAAHLLFVGVNCSLAFFLGREKAIEYLGQVNMLALETIILLLPLLAITYFTGAIEWFIFLWLVFLSLFIIKEYFRRMKYANIMLEHKAIIAVNLICIMAFLAYVFH